MVLPTEAVDNWNYVETPNIFRNRAFSSAFKCIFNTFFQSTIWAAKPGVLQIQLTKLSAENLGLGLNSAVPMQ